MVDDDTPESSAVSSGEGAVGSRPEAAGRVVSDTSPPEGSEQSAAELAPARTSAPPSSLFEPTSEEEELAVDSGWEAVRPSAAQAGSEPATPAAELASDVEPSSSVTHATPRAPEVELLARSEAARGAAPLPHLQLAAPEPPRLLYERSQEPSDDSPILYCERVFVVDGLLSDDELADHLLSVLGSIRESWRARDSSQFVQLAAFDHSFESEPRFPPLATLSWKDWQGRTELWVRGVRRSGPPPALDELDGEELAPGQPAEAEPATAAGAGALEGTPFVTPSAPERSRPRPGDSGTSWQSPARSGEYPIPTASTEEEDAEAKPPSSQRVPAGEELLAALFERMHELAYLPDLRAGAAYIVETLEEFIPCSGIAIHVLDAAACEFVLVRALAPRAADQLGTRQPDIDSTLGAAMREQRALRLDGSRNPLWRALGLTIAHALCAPAQQRGHVFGAIEIGRSASEGDFNDGQLAALEFIGEQFAEFLAERPLDLADFR